MRKFVITGGAAFALLTGTAAAGSSGWSIEPTPHRPGTIHSYLIGVSCTRPRACTAVGYYALKNGPDRTLAERWDGHSWSIERTPHPTVSLLSGVSCSSASACVGVGEYSNSSGTFTLAERWNGGTWSVQGTPNPVGLNVNSLFDVSCTSVNACTAVGYFSGTSADMTLAERWDGHTWSIQPTPNPTGSPGSYLNSVSCVSADSCTAVGYYLTPSGGRYRVLAEQWDGHSWSIQPTPHLTGSAGNYLSGVSCTSGSACTAVGQSYTGPRTGVTLAERWDGTAWSIQPTPNPRGNIRPLDDVSCTSARACTAVGVSADARGYAGATLAERWNGTSWSIRSTPNRRHAPFSGLDAVSCASQTACTAGGNYTNRDAVDLTLAEGWTAAR